MIKNVDTIEEARDAFDTLVEKLKDSCLLLDSDKKMHVRMHDLVCEVSVLIASRDQQVLSVEYGAEMKEWPDKDFFRSCSKMSLKSSNIPMLSQVPAEECQNLEMIYFYKEDVRTTEFPSNFFTEMKKLKVLGIPKLFMTSLPSSLECLKNLQTLSLEECFLVEDVTLVGHLTNLEILSFSRSNIRQLPKEIGNLIRLRWLNLSDCGDLQVISPNVFSRLEKLEELRMKNVFLTWEGERGSSNIASLMELKDLPRLTAMDIYIQDANILPPNFFSSKLVRYEIYIGDVWMPRSGYKRNTSKIVAETVLNTLKLKLVSGNDMDQGIKGLLKRSEDLSLDGSEKVNSILPHLLLIEEFQQLIHLHLQNNVDLTYIIDQKVVYPNLTTLSAYRLNHLQFLFSFSMAKSLVELKHLKVTECENMEEILSTRDQANGEKINVVFCKLESLTLDQLPNLARFCTESSTELSPVKKFENKVGASIFDSTSGTTVLTCFFDAQIIFPSLERLDVGNLGKLQTLWNNKKLVDGDSFHKLREVRVHCCDNLMNMFVPGMMGRLNALEALHIKKCDLLELVFEVGRVEVEGHLKPIYCQNLGIVTIWECESLRYIFPASVARGLQNLYSLNVGDCDKVDEIIDGEHGLENKPYPLFEFPRVTNMHLSNLPKLCRFYPGLHASKWPLLRELYVNKCDEVGKLKIVVAELPSLLEKHDQLDPLIEQSFFQVEKDSFPRLESLTLPFSEIWYGPSSPAEAFSKLISISLYSETTPFSKQANVDVLNKLQKLARLGVGWNDSTELFVRQEINSAEEIHPFRLSGVKTLDISGMDKLLHLGNENSQTAGPLFPNLGTLQVTSCMLLKSVESSAISFCCLTTLTIHKCAGMEYLISYSVAKSLTQLTTLQVYACDMLRVVIEHDHDAEGTRDITFSRLRYLRLLDLPKLRGFCSENCIVTLPSSTMLGVRNCRIELEISFEGILLSHENTNPQEDLDQMFMKALWLAISESE